jgi:hypothetical protein
MNRKKSTKSTSLPQKLALPAIFVLVFVGLVFFELLPTASKIKRASETIVTLQGALQQQKALLPIHAALQERKKKTLPEGITVTTPEQLQVENLAELPNVFQSLTRQSKVTLVSVTPQVKSLQGGRELLKIDTRVRGRFLDFNRFLNQLNEMPFVESIESLAINVTDLGQEMKLSIWLAIQ